MRLPPLLVFGETVGVRGNRGKAQNRGKAPSPAALRAVTSPRKREEEGPESTSPRSTKWASRSITKSRRTGLELAERRGAPQTRQGRKEPARASRRSMRWDRALSRRQPKKKLAHAPPSAAPACAAAGSRDGGNASRKY